VSHEIGTPRMPAPPANWDAVYMRDFNRLLEDWMRRMTSESNQEAGGIAFSEVTVDTLVGFAGGFYLVDTTGGNIAITLPDATLVLGREFVVKRKTAGANTLTITPTSGTIDGAVNLAIVDQYSTVTFKSDGTDYFIVSGYIATWVP